MTSFSQHSEQFSLYARSIPELLLLLLDSFDAPRLHRNAVDSFVRTPGNGRVPEADGLVLAAGSEQVGIRGVKGEVEDGLSSGAVDKSALSVFIKQSGFAKLPHPSMASDGPVEVYEPFSGRPLPDEEHLDRATSSRNR